MKVVSPAVVLPSCVPPAEVSATADSETAAVGGEEMASGSSFSMNQHNLRRLNKEC